MDAKTIRRMNARNLAVEVGGVTALASMAGTSQSYLSQIIGPKPCREVGDTLARKLEQATGKPYGWLDHTHVTDDRLDKARRVYDALLEMPDDKIEGIMALLNLSSQQQPVMQLGDSEDVSPAPSRTRATKRKAAK